MLITSRVADHTAARGCRWIAGAPAAPIWRLRPVVLFLMLACGHPAVRAATLTWYASGSTGAAGGGGTWDTSAQQWTTGGAWSAWSNTNGDVAVLGGLTGGSVKLSTAIQANGLTLNTNGYVITGTTLVLTGSSPTVTLATGISGTIASPLAGASGLNKAGLGTLTLSGSNSYAGGTTLAGGTLVMGNAAALGVTTNSLAINAGTLNTGTFNLTVGALSGSTGTVITTATTAGTRTLSTAIDSGTAVYAGSLRDNGIGKFAIVKTGSGTLLLTGSNAATGGTVLNAGTLRVGNALALGGTATALAVNGGTLDTGTFGVSVGALSGSAGGVITTATNAGTRTLTTTVAAGTSVFAGTIQNSGSGVMALTKAGVGMLVLSGSNAFTGLTTISAGTLQVGDGGTSGGLGSGAIANSGLLVFNRNDGYGGPVANTITGTGGLTVSRGSLTLSGSTGFTGDTRVLSGTLTLANTRALGGSTLDMNTLDSGIVVFSATGAQTYVLGGLEGSRTLSIGDDSLSVGGNNQSTAYSGTLVGTGGLVKTGFGTLTLTGSNAHTGGTTISGGTLQVGDGGTAGALGSGAVTNNGVLAFNRSDNYGGAFAAVISGSGSLRLLSGSLTLGANNSYGGATTVSGGVLQVGNGGTTGSLGTGAVVNSGTLVFNRTDDYGGPVGNAISGVGSLAINRGSLTLTGSSTFTGATTIAGGTLQVGNGGVTGRIGSGPITNNGALVFSRVDGYGGTVTNLISGSGSLTVAGGTLALSGSNTYTGTTRIAVGVLALSNTSALAGSTLDMNGADSGSLALSVSGTQTYSLGGLSGSRNLAIGGNTLAIGGNNKSTTYSGALSGSGSLVKTGSGTLTATGSHSYTGGTYVLAGRLVGTTASLSGTINSQNTFGSALEFAQATDGTFAGRINGGIELPFAVIKSGSGVLTVTGSLTGNTAVSINQGRLVLGASNTDWGSITNNAELELRQVASGTMRAWLAGAGVLLKTGSGTLTLQGGAVTGTTTVSAGRLVASASTLRGPIVNNAAFEFAQSINGDYASVISGSGALVKSGAGTLVISGTSLVTGVTTVSGGILATGGTERLADTSTVNISAGATLRLGGNETIAAILGSGSVNLQGYRLSVAGSGSSSYSGSIFGSGGLTKGGSGILTLGGLNGFLGATNLNAGTLVLSSSMALSPYTTLNIAAGASLVVNRDVRVFAYTNSGGTISGTGRLLTSATATTSGTLTSLANASGVDGYDVGLLKTSTATLVVSGSTSFTGGIVVEQGTVKLDAGGSFAASNVVDVRSGATLDLNGQSQTVAALAGSGSVALGGGTLTVAATTNTTYEGTLAGGTLVKTGSSSLNLVGVANVTTASVASGLMSINGVLSGTVQVAPGGALGGAGVVVGDVLVSGTHAPGNSPDISTIAGNLNYGSGATVVWEIAGNSDTQGPVGSRAFDQILVGGNLAFSGSTALVLSFFDQDPNSSWTSAVDWSDDFWKSNRAWTIWQVSGTTSGFSNLTLQPASWLDSNDVQFASALPSGSFSLEQRGNDVSLIYTVPEPAATALVISGVLFGLAVRRRRKGQIATPDATPPTPGPGAATCYGSCGSRRTRPSR